jgi:hypothetical protein
MKVRTILIYVGVACYVVIGAAMLAGYYSERSRFFRDCPWGSKEACEAQWAAMHPNYADVDVWAPMRRAPPQQSARQ